MFQADSGLRLILSLAARTRGTVGLNDDLLLEDLRIGIEFHRLTPRGMEHKGHRAEDENLYPYALCAMPYASFSLVSA